MRLTTSAVFIGKMLIRCQEQHLASHFSGVIPAKCTGMHVLGPYPDPDRTYAQWARYGKNQIFNLQTVHSCILGIHLQGVENIVLLIIEIF